MVEWAIGVVQRGWMDSVAGGDFLDLVDAVLGDEASALGEGLKAALESQGHAFE